MTAIGTWDAISSVVTVSAASAAIVLALGCLWPADQHRPPKPPRRATSLRKPVRTQCMLRPFQLPEAWSCAAPTRPFTLADAHRWMQTHRDHNCARKRAAFAALVAAGRITPDSHRHRQ